MFLSRTAYLAASLTLLTTTSAFAQQQQQQQPAPQTPLPSVPARPLPPSVDQAPPVKLPAGVAARVNGQDLTYAELNQTLKAWAGRPLLQQVVQVKVFEQEAKKQGVSVTPAELLAEIEKFKQGAIDRQLQSGTGMMTWPEIAARDGVSEGFLADFVRLDLLKRKTFEKVIEKNIPSLEGQIKVAHILIPTVDLQPPKPDAKPKTAEETAKRDADAKKQAEQLVADISAKNISFEDAAKQFSGDKGPNGAGSAANGGVLPYFGRNYLDPAFDKAAFALAKPGDMTPAPVKSRYGYHIIKLIQKGTGAPDAEKAAYKKEQVALQMQNPEGLPKWTQFLMSTAKINYGVSAAPAPASSGATKPAVKATPAKPVPAKKSPKAG